jgi:3alpha(or 20beta)-hydroxysteroid dehydrogenase
VGDSWHDEAAAVEPEADRIRVNSVHPGLIATDMAVDIGLADKGVEIGALWTPIGRVGTADEVDGVVIRSPWTSDCSRTGG